MNRFKSAYNTYLYSFTNEFLVVCPFCGKQALVKKGNQAPPLDTKLTCVACGYNKTLSETPPEKIMVGRRLVLARSYMYGTFIDPYFKLPLWLISPCRGELLWAYNYEHLTFLENFIAAKLRERNFGYNANSSMGSRLPKWMTSEKNRVHVIKAIRALKAK